MILYILNTVFEEKEELKKNGAKWHPQKQLWYVPPGTLLRPFALRLGYMVQAKQLPLEPEATAHDEVPIV